MRGMVEEALAEAMPYLQNPEWLKWKLSLLLGENPQPERLIQALEEAVKVEEEPTRRTDLRIFLQYFRRISKT